MISASVGTQIQKLVGPGPSDDSKDLVLMTEKFNSYKAKLSTFVAALHSQYAAVKQLNECRLSVAGCISDLAEMSPISRVETESVYVHVNNDGHTETDIATFYNINLSLYSTRKKYEQSFYEFVLQYVVEWEQTIVGRIVASLEQAETLRLEVDHYEEKLKSLTSPSSNWLTTLFLAWSLDDSDPERIQRSTIKYQDARNTYAQYAKDLRLLIEEVTDRGWRELFPLLMKLVSLDVSLAVDENQLLTELIGVTGGTKEVADQHELKSRIKENDLSNADIESVLADERSCNNSHVSYELMMSVSSADQNSNVLPQLNDHSDSVTPQRRAASKIDAETPIACGSRYLLEAEEIFMYFLDDN